MPLSHLYTLLCDEVRVENNGKLILIGVYTPDILVPQLPFAFASLTFFQTFNADRGGRVQFTARLQNMESGREIARAMGLLNVAQPGFVVSVLRFGGVNFDSVGHYNFIVNIEEQVEAIIHSFNVVLQAVQQQR